MLNVVIVDKEVARWKNETRLCHALSSNDKGFGKRKWSDWSDWSDCRDCSDDEPMTKKRRIDKNDNVNVNVMDTKNQIARLKRSFNKMNECKQENGTQNRNMEKNEYNDRSPTIDKQIETQIQSGKRKFDRLSQYDIHCPQFENKKTRYCKKNKQKPKKYPKRKQFFEGKLCEKILCFENVLSNVLQFLKFEETIRFRTINQYYKKVLAFQLDMKIVNNNDNDISNCSNNNVKTFDIYFESNKYKYICKLLSHYFCDNLSNIAWYYLQCQNVKLVNWCFDKNKERTKEVKMKMNENSSKSKNRSKYLFSCDFDLESLKKKYKIENEKYKNNKNWHSMGVDLSIVTNNDFNLNKNKNIFYESFSIGFWLHESSSCLIRKINSATNKNHKHPLNVKVNLNNVFKFIKHQMICINKMYKDNNNGINHFRMKRCNEFMTLAVLNDIKPMRTMFENLLLKNEKYGNILRIENSDTIRASFDISGNFDSDFKFMAMSVMGHSLPFLWQKMGNKCLPIFSTNELSKRKMHQMRCLIADVCCKGNFDFYKKYIKSIDNDLTKIEKNAPITSGMAGLMILFMRLDLIDSYVHYDNLSITCAREMTYFLLNPQYLNEYKKNLEENILITPLTDKESFEFDLLNNERYLPENRIKMIAKLCFCPMMASSLLWRKGIIYIEPTYDLYKLVMKLYNDFDYFCKLWLINDYTHLKNNKWKQKQIHEKFQIAIQGLVCFCTFYLCGVGHRENPGNIMLGIEREVCNIGNDDFVHKLKRSLKKEFIYFKPEKEQDIDNLCQYLTEDFTRQGRCWFTQQPGIDYQFRKTQYKSQPLMKIKNTHLLMHQVFDICNQQHSSESKNIANASL